MSGQEWALITGAGSGIGAALAGELAARGLAVALVGRRAQALQAVADARGTDGALCIPADVAKPDDRARVCGELRDSIGPAGLRHIVHCAGIGDPAPDLAGTDPAHLEAAFAVNVTAPLALTQTLMPDLRRAAPARVLMVGAGIGDRPQPGTGVYGITKAALARLVRQMVVDLDREGAPDSPAVALFQPGLVDTAGIHAHVAAARACGLPHADGLADSLSAGEATNAPETARAMADVLMLLPRDDFHGMTLRPCDVRTT